MRKAGRIISRSRRSARRSGSKGNASAGVRHVFHEYHCAVVEHGGRDACGRRCSAPRHSRRQGDIGCVVDADDHRIGLHDHHGRRLHYLAGYGQFESCMVFDRACGGGHGRLHGRHHVSSAAKAPKMLVGLLYPAERPANRILKKFKQESALRPLGGEGGCIIWRRGGHHCSQSENSGEGLRLLHRGKHVRTCGVLPGGRCVQYHESRSADMRLRYCYAACHQTPPVPQGVGFVEAGVMVLFSAYDINSAAGMASVLVYRGLVFWMPFLIGAVLIQRTKTFGNANGGKKGKPAKSSRPSGRFE